MLELNSITIFLVVGLCISLVFYYVIFIYKNWKILKFAYQENGFFLPVFPLIGNTYVALLTGQKANILSTLQWLTANIGLPYGVWRGHAFLYVTNNPAEIKIILNHPQCYGKAKVYDNLKFLFRSSILLVPYTSVGLNKEEWLNEMDRFGELLNMIQDELVHLLLDPVTPPTIWFNIYPAGRRAGRLIKEAEHILEQVINAKRKQCDHQEYCQRNDGLYPLMDLMMEMPNDKIFEELFLFASAATDATGIAMAFTFTLLGMNPDSQETLYNEVISVAGYKDISHYDLPNLKYTEAAISESLRLLPPVPNYARQINADVDIGTKVIPSGIDVAIDVFQLHRDPRYWKDPLKFDPTRFLPENASNIQPYTYLPFSGGARDCLGKVQAMMLLKITVANVVRKFRIISKYQSVEEIILMSCATMKSTHPLDCHFTRRLPK